MEYWMYLKNSNTLLKFCTIEICYEYVCERPQVLALQKPPGFLIHTKKIAVYHNSSDRYSQKVINSWYIAIGQNQKLVIDENYIGITSREVFLLSSLFTERKNGFE